MAEDPMGRFPTPSVEDLPPDVRERIEEETERAGFTPNVFPAFGYRPSHFRAFFDYHDALVDNTALERVEIEMIIVTISGVNDCLYCVVAHGALLRYFSEDPSLADKLATNHRTADLSARHRAMLDFAVKLTERPGDIDDADLAALQEVGFSEQAIWDIGSVTAFYNLSNRMASLTDMRPNEEFYGFARTPPDEDA